MANQKNVVEFVASDLGSYTLEETVCTNCIKGFCPARTPSIFDATEFTFCGARKNADEIVERYTARTGIELHIEKPC